MSAFELTGVVHLARPTGRMAHDLDELRNGIEAATPQVLFLHAIQVILRQGSSEDPPADDFTAWVYGVVQDRETSERLAFATRDHTTSAPALRAALLAVLDGIPQKTRAARDAAEGGEFAFITVDSVPVPTGIDATDANGLIDALLEADDTVWFWHLFEEPWIRAGECPLGNWLRASGAESMAQRLEQDARSGLSIETIRRRTRRMRQRGQLARRVAEAVGASEDERREEARSVVAGLVSRMKRREG
jgi:hypothetical protein